MIFGAIRSMDIVVGSIVKGKMGKTYKVGHLIPPDVVRGHSREMTLSYGCNVRVYPIPSIFITTRVMSSSDL